MGPSPKENSFKTVTTPVEIKYRLLFMYSSTEPDTLRPVQEDDREVAARDYVKMARWDYRSGNRSPSQVFFLPPESNCAERGNNPAIR
uniref:Uncharacterized protein n=1 Tax=Peronospora matthiolae TaxID=2874970 RepID=A0AAV1TAB9_9STRA